MSWTSKAKHREYMLSSIQHGRRDILAPPCEDDYSDCYKFVNYCSVKIIQNQCRVTCGTCKAFGPPKNCAKSTYGCCWDNITAASGKDFQGCKDCVDEYAECSYFKGRCHEPGAEKIRLACPVTCNVGCHKKQCLDDKYQAPVCQLYKKYGFCDASQYLMRKLCAKTCGFC